MQRLSTLLIAALLTISCSRHQPIRIRSDYIDRNHLASYHVDTPDPLLNCPPVGQRLVLSWSLSKRMYRKEGMRIVLTIVFGDHTKSIKVIEPHRQRGIDVTTLLDDTYFDRCGILTYKAELFSGNVPLYCWRHQLWSEVITFPTCEETQQAPLAP